MTETNDLLSPGDVPTRIPGSRSLPGSALAKQALGNLLWRGAQDFYEGIVKPPGQILEGSLVPAMEPGPNMLSIPEYATGLALSGLGAGNLLGGAGEGAARQFGAWHGTRAQPFQEFSDEFLRSGEGHMTYGHGHYVGQAEGTGRQYRKQAAGAALVPVDEQGIPLMGVQTAEKFYEPGTIVPSYGGYDKVVSFEPATAENNWNWNVRVQTAHPKLESSAGIIDMLRDPEQWNVNPNEYVRSHATMPDERELAAVARARGWQMGEPGALLHINVIPEEHEFLDWDLPFSKQSPQVQERLLNLEGRYNSLTSSDPELSSREAWRDYLNNVNPNGEGIYRQLHYDNEARGLPWDEAWEQTSKDLQEAGIPGNKYLDQQSRNLPPGETLTHKGGLLDAPDFDLARQHLQGLPRMHDSLEKEVGMVKSNISVDMRGALNNIEKIKADIKRDPSSAIYNDPEGYLIREQARLQQLRNLSNWIDNEHAAGNFHFADTRTRNFVVFDPKNLEIRTWNGRLLTSVEGDPFDVTRP